MKTFLLVLTYLVGAGELILAIYFWMTNSKNEIRKVMALLAFSTSIWVISSALTSYTAQTPITTVFMRVVFASGAILITALLHLALIYPFQIMRLDKVHGWLLYGPSILFSLVSFFSNSIVLGFTGSREDSGRILPGQLYVIYNVFVFGVYLLALIIFFYRKKSSDAQHRINLNLIAWSVLIGGIPAVLIDLLIPIVTRGVYPNANYGALSTVVWLGVTTYILLKK